LKRTEKIALAVLLAGALLSLVVAPLGNGSRWVTAAGLMLDMAGIVQLEIAGLFDKIAAEYFDEARYPYGPPSHITREIIDNPDAPVRVAVRNTMFFNGRMGFWLLVGGFALQLLGAWLG
jgi:hypothetical protein